MRFGTGLAPVLAVILIYAIAAVLINGHGLSLDLYALYFASYNLDLGNLDQIYFAEPRNFQLRAPDLWAEQADAFGIAERPLYPYIYPPIWAVLFAPIARGVDPYSFAYGATFLNAVLFGVCAILSYRIIRPAIPMVVWVVAALAIVSVTNIGILALAQNQPQIIVSLLILLAFERDRANAPWAAGAALALAAAIKLYPLLFVVLWLGARNWRAILGFVVTGAILGGVSVALAGWPLHQIFLHEIRVIANSLVIGAVTPNLDAMLGQLWLRDFLIAGYDPTVPFGTSQYMTAPKPPALIWFDRAVLLSVLILAFQAARRATRHDLFHRLAPAVIIVIALVSPLTWTYHYLPIAFLLPALALRQHGWGVTVALVLLFSQPVILALDAIPTPFHIGQILWTLGMAATALLFLRAPMR